MKKKYKLRVYITSEEMGLVVNDMIDVGLFPIGNSYDGFGDVLAIYDGEITSKGIKLLNAFKVPYFPLDHYEDFRITCPNCGEPINDDMILKVYDDKLLSGFNIDCYRCDGAIQMADVTYLLD